MLVNCFRGRAPMAACKDVFAWAVKPWRNLTRIRSLAYLGCEVGVWNRFGTCWPKRHGANSISRARSLLRERNSGRRDMNLARLPRSGDKKYPMRTCDRSITIARARRGKSVLAILLLFSFFRCGRRETRARGILHRCRLFSKRIGARYLDQRPEATAAPARG